MNETAPEKPPEDPIDPLWIAEFACWTMVVLAPILSWINGPSVSTDQFVVRAATFCLALTGALTLRVGKMIRTKRRSRDAEGPKA